MDDTHEEKMLEALYGPLCRYSEHKRGDRMSYREVGVLRTGIVLWVCGPGPVVEGGAEHPLRYIVDAGLGMPDTVYPQEVQETRSAL